MKNIRITNTKIFACTAIFALILLSCRSKKLNYIDYYHQVYNIDSTFRLKKDTLTTIAQYKKLFKKYPPKNQDRIDEFENYILFSDKFHKNFGGKKSLYKLIPLIAPYWKYKKEDSGFIGLYQKYGISRQEMEGQISQWKKNLNQKLIDSFTVAFKRDQDSRINSKDIIKNDKKNAELLKWMFENYGFPSLQKIGLWNNDFFIPSGPVLLHMADYEEYHQYFKTKVLEYVKSGDCPPRDYAAMMDRYYLHVIKKEVPYGVYIGYENIKDSASINRNRKIIGLPSMQHAQKITKDFLMKQKKKYKSK